MVEWIALRFEISFGRLLSVAQVEPVRKSYLQERIYYCDLVLSRGRPADRVRQRHGCKTWRSSQLAIGFPRPIDLDRTGGLAAGGVAQVRRDATIFSLELLDRIKGRVAAEEGKCWSSTPPPGKQ